MLPAASKGGGARKTVHCPVQQTRRLRPSEAALRQLWRRRPILRTGFGCQRQRQRRTTQLPFERTPDFHDYRPKCSPRPRILAAQISSKERLGVGPSRRSIISTSIYVAEKAHRRLRSKHVPALAGRPGHRTPVPRFRLSATSSIAPLPWGKYTGFRQRTVLSSGGTVILRRRALARHITRPKRLPIGSRP